MSNASFCSECSNKTCLQTKPPSPCKAVEKELKKVSVGRRNWQTTVDPACFERMPPLELQRRLKRKHPFIYNNDFEQEHF